MRKNAEIRLLRLFEAISFPIFHSGLLKLRRKLAKHAPDCFLPDNFKIREMHKTKKIYSFMPFLKHNFIRMHFYKKSFAQEVLNVREELFEFLPVFRQKNKIIRVSNVMCASQLTLDVLIKRIEVHICKQLRSKIAERNTLARSCREAANNIFKQLQESWISSFLAADTKQHFVIYAIEEFPDVAFQKPYRARTVSRKSLCEIVQSVICNMRAFCLARRIRIENKCLVEPRNQNPANRMMQNPIAHRRFGNKAALRIMNKEPRIRAVSVRAASQILVQLNKIALSVFGKFQNIYLACLSVPKFAPCSK
ncbi:hypothetical protein A2763_03385 [Candidatus Kaiserbacteria bacterium RIFCSPHIGHO2_01_FULL_54_36]|uniref:Uncharacterized protein n=1 Tax=Candidatus Kaiserbacteria bacterium RIFCSPHIGHO2_01_FULL_54_36 TaxID=1798482 RepID=A0A1F6CKC6_9BACT|nr:MAG: hypothetical protein A2763_03385 [Candidatus Kaiserbacteria bacterium RIFCSPHIGHO2_01_FULL_54_36]OGG75926.1 MAG: hypothetical protein A3A41_00525 [Candidatus Kaiserbacteria bacterium RIFCSPLOWO2_01_FULL_54_22]